MSETTPKTSNASLPVWAKNAVIYEVNVRQFSKEGTLSKVTEALPRIRKMGVDIVWLMPIYPISKEKRKGTLGSPYAVADYKGVNPEFGNLDDLRQLVKKAHAEGMYVILDYVPNHTGWDNHWITEHPDWYTHVDGKITDPLDEHGKSVGWEDVADLNYNNKDLRKAVVDVLTYWLKEADIDGYRMDVAGFVPYDFWNEAIPQLQKVKHGFYLAEWDNPEMFNNGFHACYGWGFHALCKQLYKGEKKLSDLVEFMTKEHKENRKGFMKMMFTSNHDENSWNGTEQELFGPSVDAMNILCFTLDGIPLIYNGQEAGLNKRLAFFEKDPIDWSHFTKDDFYAHLSKLKHDNPALWNGEYGALYERIPSTNDDNVFAYIREKDKNQVLVVINMSGHDQQVNLNSDKIANGYHDAFGGAAQHLSKGSHFSLKPWQYHVLIKD